MRSRRLAISILLACVSLCRAEEAIFTQYTSRDGLSQNWVQTILQDSYGFMWFGTKDGLNRFDGYEFKVFQYDSGNPASLHNNTVNTLLEDEDGDLWIGTSGGLAKYQRSLGEFKSISALPETDVLSILPHKGALWIGTIDGLYHYDPATDEVLARPFRDAIDRPAENGPICWDIIVDTRDQLWVAHDQGLSLIGPGKTPRVDIPLGNGAGEIPGDEARALAEDRFGRLWIGTTNGGLFALSPDDFPPNTPTFTKVMDGSIMALDIDAENQLWIGRNADGRLNALDLNDFNEGRQTIREFVGATRDRRDPGGSSIHTLLVDRNQDVWIGTYTGGVAFFNRNQKPFLTLLNDPSNPATLPHNTVNVFLEDGDFLWLGTEAGLSRLDRTSGELRRFIGAEDDSSIPGTNGIYALEKDANGDIWIGTWAQGIYKFNQATKTFDRYTAEGPPGKSINSDNVFALHDDGKGSVWIGTIGGGLNRYDHQTGRFSYYRNDPNSDGFLDSDYINDILSTRDGNLWVSSYDAINRFDNERQAFERIHRDEYQENGMSRADLLCLFEDSANNLWLGTEAGLIHFDRSQRSFRRFTVADGLPSDVINSILEDDQQNLWVSTNQGLVKFYDGVSLPAEPAFRAYSYADGLQSSQFIPRAGGKTRDGYLFFGGVDGLTYFKPELITDNPTPPPVVITDFLLFNQSVTRHTPNSPLKASIVATKRITLSAKHSVFSFQYAALNYDTPERNQYRYKLEGFENEWNEVGDRRLATYTNMTPGEYTFRVIASNNDGIWNENGASIEIHVLPPWWKTPLFLGSMAILVVLLLTGAYRLRIAGLRKQQRLLEDLVSQRTRSLSEANAELESTQEEITLQNSELESHRNHLEELVRERAKNLEDALSRAEVSDRLKSAFLSNMSHEIRTPMNAIVGFSSLLGDHRIDEDSRADYINLIRNNADVLLSLIDGIIEVSRIEANEIIPKTQLFEVDLKLEEIETAFDSKHGQNLQIAFVGKDPIKRAVIDSDPQLVQEILTHLLDNAVKFTSKGRVEFGYKIINDIIEFYVMDTGIGIHESEFEKIFEHFYKVEDSGAQLFRGVGLGLYTARSLARLLGGEIRLTSTPGKGSTFFFSMPMRQMQTQEK